MTAQPIPLHAPKHAWFGQDPLENVGLTELFTGTNQSGTGFSGATLDWIFDLGPETASLLLDLSAPTLPSFISGGTYAVSLWTWADASAFWDANGYWQLNFNFLSNVGFWFPSIDGVPTDTNPGHAIPVVTSATLVVDAGATMQLQCSNRDSHTRNFLLKQAAVTKISG